MRRVENWEVRKCEDCQDPFEIIAGYLDEYQVFCPECAEYQQGEGADLDFEDGR